MKKFRSVFLLLVVFALFFGSMTVHAADRTANDILQAQFEKEDVSDANAYLDALAKTPDDGREWYAFALAFSDPTLDASAYARALETYVTEKDIKNAVSKQKFALVLLACGLDSDFINETPSTTVGKLGVMSYVFGLHLANNGQAPDDMKIDEIVDALLSMHLAGGGYAVSGEYPHPDVTAMALQALASHYGIREDVRTAVDADLALLSDMQTENGGFVAYGIENPESTAQVMLALTALGIDPDTDERFIKNGNTLTDAILRFQLENGTFSHEIGGKTDEKANMQVLLAMLAKEKNSNPYLLEPTTNAPEKSDYRLPVILGIVAAALIVCLVLFLCKKRNYKHYLAVGIVAAVAIILVLFVKIESTDSYYSDIAPKENVIGTVTLSIRCDVLVGKTDSEYIPADGILLPTTTFELTEGDTVYTILTEAARKHRIQMETSASGELAYIEGLANLYEAQFGATSGWTYSVNGERASVGCGRFELSPGDVICWDYSLDLK